MKELFKSVFYPRIEKEKSNIEFLNVEEAKKAYDFHSSFDVYKQTPLHSLNQLASALNVEAIYLKDESFRFNLNAFKVLGGSYAIGRYIAQQLKQDIETLPASLMMSDSIKEQVGELTFVTATDGNHGRGVAWTANQLKQKSVVYMPKGAAQERLDNILAEGSDASITDMNYDEAVRLANSKAESNGWVIVQDTAWVGYTNIPTWIMQGYMTLGYEITQQLDAMKLQAPTHLFLQAGVGSLAGAICGFFANYYGENQPKTIIIEPNKADCIYKTALANDGELHFVGGDLDTIMAGLACGEPNIIGWNVLKDYADGFISAPDYVAADGMRILASPLGNDPRIVSGESGAATLGCITDILLDQDMDELKASLGINETSRLLFISTEGDTDKKNFQDVIWGGRHSRYEGEQSC